MTTEAPAPPRRNAIGRLLAGDPFHTVIAAILDILVVAAGYGAALLLRFDGEVPRVNAEFTTKILPFLALGFIAANVFFGVYRTVWAYGSLGDIMRLFRAVFAVTAAVFAINFWVPNRDLPLSVILIAGILVFPGMAFVKMRARLLSRLPWASVSSRRLLIIGAGHTGQALSRELQNSPGLNYQPIGYLDDDPRKQHTRVLGLPVFSGTHDLTEAIKKHDVEVVAIAIPHASGQAIRRIVAACQEANVAVRMVPGVEKWVLGHHDALRDITLDDLLGRDPVQVDYAACSHSVKDKVVLVTGAAGSIGSELCRQLLSFHPRELHMVDNNESGLHDLYRNAFEFSGLSAETTVRLWIANVVDEQRIDEIFAQVRPDLVYHAAALKHVPLMEEHPGEAYRVNVLGTLNVARAARTYQAGTFVLISTDKAVRPSSIMGATKRIAELLVLALARESELTNYAAVRFGNVMGSRGSVVPTFMGQIERGGPVTVMHRDMMRYFISIPEAVSLVIQAGTFGGHGNIYMLDMGEEINILELAERMIRLRGLRPGEDIEVVFTGPRPGEKLREELVADFEDMTPTAHPKVMQLKASVEVTEAEIRRLIDELGPAMFGDEDELRRRIHLVARRYSLEDETPASVPADEPAAP
ncbi:MAG: polysaccharide biosynthesis protein [Chloroflexi bacterium]|nr:polysaccharide biosynthesis protein [Chloroflexota bacterium]